MRYFKQIADDVDIAPILSELSCNSEMWTVDTSRQRKVRCQRETKNIFLRAARKPLPAGAKNANNVHESRTMPAAKHFPRALKFCEDLANRTNGELGRATLVALQPRGRVYPHKDLGDYYRIRDRFHLVLESREGSPLSAEEDVVVMQPGELWVFDNKVRHWAENASDESRIHLIFDILPAPGQGYYTYPLDSGS